MSWHIDKKGKSFINDLLDLTEKYIIEIVTDSEQYFMITEEDDVIVGDGTILLNHHTDDGARYVDLINANKIESIQLKEYKEDSEGKNVTD